MASTRNQPAGSRSQKPGAWPGVSVNSSALEKAKRETLPPIEASIIHLKRQGSFDTGISRHQCDDAVEGSVRPAQ